VVLGLFPSWAVEKPTVDAADTYLAEPAAARASGSSAEASDATSELPASLRRLVSEGRAGVVRALAAREFDQS
jgi:aminopeptidase N